MLMNQTDLQEIGSLIEEKLEPIKEILEEHTQKLDGIIDQFAEVSEDVTEIKEKSITPKLFRTQPQSASSI